ncbi:MAG: HD domain-containing protein [bacterium]|nr:HD domain-containing protein [bacterium]
MSTPLSALTPRPPRRPLVWPDAVLDLHDAFLGTWREPLYIVGGAVRDAYQSRPVKDLDFATPGDAIAAARRVANYFNGDVYVMDAERGVARVFVETQQGKLALDFARFRADDLLADLTERDFTLNAIAVDFTGNDLNQIIDPLNGEQDLIEKVIRRCSPQSILHDPIRALRAVRQSAQLSARIEPETLKDIRAAAARVNETSPERVRDEFMKMLSLMRPIAGVRVADSLGLLQHILPEVTALHGMMQSPPHSYDAWTHTMGVVERLRSLLNVINPKHSNETAAVFDLGVAVMLLVHHREALQAHLAGLWPNERSHEALLILAALLHDAGKAVTAAQDEQGRWHFPDHARRGAQLAAERAAALRLSSDEKQRLYTVIDQHMHRIFWEPLTDLAIHRYWWALGQAGVDVCLLVLADYLGGVGYQLDQDAWLTLVQQVRRLLDAYYLDYERLVAPPPLLEGNGLMQALALKPGPVVGELLTLIREGQAAGEITTVEAALEAARTYLKQHNVQS